MLRFLFFVVVVLLLLLLFVFFVFLLFSFFFFFFFENAKVCTHPNSRYTLYLKFDVYSTHNSNEK